MEKKEIYEISTLGDYFRSWPLYWKDRLMEVAGVAAAVVLGYLGMVVCYVFS